MVKLTFVFSVNIVLSLIFCVPFFPVNNLNPKDAMIWVFLLRYLNASMEDNYWLFA